MRLVYLSNAAVPSRAANGVHIMKMCAAFAAAGHDVTLLARRGSDGPGDVFAFYGVPPSFAIRHLPRAGGTMGEYGYAAACAWAVRRLKPDLVFSRYLLGSVAAALAGVPGGLELHQPVPAASRLQRRLFHAYVRRPEFRRLVVITRPLLELFRDADGISADRILVAPDGADLPGENVDAWRPDPQGFHIGYLGHLYPGRGIELILALARRCPWATFHIVGGTDEDVARVRQAAAGDANVTVHGFVPPARAEAMRLGMDVLLAPYQSVVGLGSGTVTTERWMSPLKIFEYMAAGKAIVSSDLPILRDVLVPERNALLCAPDAVAEWERSLARLRDDPELAARLGGTARADLVREYQWSRRAERILAALSA